MMITNRGKDKRINKKDKRKTMKTATKIIKLKDSTTLTSKAKEKY